MYKSRSVIRKDRSAVGGGIQTAARVFAKSPTAIVGASLLLINIGLALLGPSIAPYDYTAFHLADALQPPSWQYPGGTDQFGRDQLSRVVWGARDTLMLASASTLLGVVLGVLVGMVGAYFGGILDEILMRLMDAAMALPALLLAMLILTGVGPHPIYIILGIGFVFMPRSARVMRGVALSLAAAEFVDAARIRGEHAMYIIFREMLPNAWPQVIVELTIRFGYAVLLLTSLGFLGVGAQPPAPDWGLMVNDALPFLAQAPWLALLPALAISSAVVGANLVGDALRDAMAIHQSGESP